jgi:hypothetical protein
MSYSFYVDNNLPNPDFRIVDGQMVLVRGEDAIVQQIIITLKTEIAEWFLNINFGLPYFTATGVKNDNFNNGILGSNYDESVVQSFITGAVLLVPGVTSVVDLIVRKQGNLNLLTITGTVLVEDQEVNGIGTQQTFTVNVGE